MAMMQDVNRAPQTTGQMSLFKRLARAACLRKPNSDRVPSARVAADFIRGNRHLFDGWPSGIYSNVEEHWPLLTRVRPRLPERLRQMRAHDLWSALILALDTIRQQERREYRIRVAQGMAPMEREES